MKKTASILLLAILAFNWIGYRFVSGFMEHKADLAFETRIDNSDYDETSLIEIRVPLNAPYIAGNSTGFERYDGELELDGVHYKYVKRKVENGELVLMCLPNESKTRIQNSRTDFFKLVNDLNHSARGKDKNNTASFKAFTAEYKQENNSWDIQALVLLPLQYTVTDLSVKVAGYAAIPEQPPRA